MLLELAAREYCPRCGSSLGPGLTAGDDGCGFCPQPMPRFRRLVRLAPYVHPMRGVIHRMKYHSGRRVPAYLARLLADAVAARCGRDRPDLILAVPMHWTRRLARGFDHALALAEAIGRRLGAPVGDELTRVRNTPPQVHLAASQRAANVRGAFAAADRSTLRGAHVLLVDDVLTTGATCNEAARTLLSAGASRLTVAVLAKAEAPAAYADAPDGGPQSRGIGFGGP